MWEESLVGLTASLINLILHAVLIALVVRTVDHLAVSQGKFMHYVFQRIIVIVATGALLLAGHFMEAVVWAMTYGLVGAAPPGTDLLYFAFGNYTTLGYGDVIPVDRWRLLGPLTALNGIMLIGWSTAVILEVLRHIGRDAKKTGQLTNPAG